MANHRWQQQQQQPHEQQQKALTKLRSQHDQSEKEGERKGKHRFGKMKMGCGLA